jgi:low molecular weight phosphotyrosine protein phosphatase
VISLLAILVAEGVFRSIISKPPYAGLINVVDSAGTGGYHVGSSPDSRTMATLEAYGITDYVHGARKVGTGGNLK